MLKQLSSCHTLIIFYPFSIVSLCKSPLSSSSRSNPNLFSVYNGCLNVILFILLHMSSNPYRRDTTDFIKDLFVTTVPLSSKIVLKSLIKNILPIYMGGYFLVVLYVYIFNNKSYNLLQEICNPFLQRLLRIFHQLLRY